MKKVTLFKLPGLTSYELAWKYMRALNEYKNVQRKGGTASSDFVLFVEHSSVYTLGKGGSTEFLKFPSIPSPHKLSSEPHAFKHDCFRVERGGEVTWHGPGQLVAYPILDLNNYKKDLHWYTNKIEDVVINMLSTFGIQGERSSVNTGVWVGTNKLSAVGISASRWITYHGNSVNVDCDLDYFGNIVPCGITAPGRNVCSIQSSLTTDAAADLKSSASTYAKHFSSALMDVTANRYAASFASTFDVTIEEGSHEDLPHILKQFPLVEHASLDRIEI